MSDLISKAAACEILADLYPTDGERVVSVKDIDRVYDKIASLPYAEPERKIGHWVEIGDEPYDEWECDVCGFVIDGSGCIDPEEYRDVYRFCPRCGSDMGR